jgi:hypothetical protein
VYPAPAGDSVVTVRRDGVRISFPDVLIALNSAADSAILHGIRRELAAQRLSKTVQSEGISYAPPLLISATSETDGDTKVLWRAAKLGRWTDGHDRSLFTHQLTVTQPVSQCAPRGPIDFNQAWHCVRMPEPPSTQTPGIAMDLPNGERVGDALDLPFRRYALSPLGDPNRPETTWVFHIPEALIPDHNNIFNAKARELILALMQISGAVASLAEDWRDTFEPESV